MATLAFAAAGAAIGAAILPAGLTVLGTTITGAAIGAQIGALGGSFVDQTLLSGSGQSRPYEGPRLSDLRVTTSTEGAPVPRLYGRARVGGQIIWAADIEEQVATERAGGGGKGGFGGGSAKRIVYTYFASFAVALCEGEIAGIGRIWVDNEELDQTNTVFRLYTGSEVQPADSLIVAHEGSDRAPAYRGLAYVVFERLPITAYGNRIPQLSFEVLKPAGTLADKVRAMVVVPGSGEFVYATTPVTRNGPNRTRVSENVHTFAASTDWSASMDQLTMELPAVENVSLISCWFGSDLRAGHAQIRPGVERAAKDTRPLQWRVAGETRATAYVVSETNGAPSYGGTPSDTSLIEGIQDLKARGIAVTLTPFVLMDIPSANTLPDPYTGSVGQPVYPWRGRMTVDPAPGQPGTPDKTAAAATQIGALVGMAAVSDFQVAHGQVTYSGPNEWSYRRFILHHAAVAKAAGGIDTFVIGTEMRGLTHVRDGVDTYPFVSALAQLAADVKLLLGPQTKVTYAADWSEFFGHQPQDGSGDVYFHLDPLWASPAIDVIGIDLYWPLSDWRDDAEHVDKSSARTIYDLDYLKSNIAGGEGYDWFYASEVDREAQLRTPITDGAGQPWIFRYKDLVGWWSNSHVNRPGGEEAGSPTAWVPQSKPIWFMETGCPAIDKGANTPNRFFDPKSSESALPQFGVSRRDDLIQRQYIRAILEAFDPEHPGHIGGLNPLSPVYGSTMVDPARIYLYAWDARPFPAFPANADTWSDSANWSFGHWLNGRLAASTLESVVDEILGDFGATDFESGKLYGLVPGYIIERIMSARDALQPLEMAYFFDAVESEGLIRFRQRGLQPIVAELEATDAVEDRAGAALLTLTRGQETELPRAVKLSYISDTGDYRQQAIESHWLPGSSVRVSSASLPIMLDAGQAGAIAETWLHETWVGRERARLTLPPSRMAPEPGDVIRLTHGGRTQDMRIIEVGDHGAREIEAQAIDSEVYRPARAVPRAALSAAVPVIGIAEAAFLDLPLLRGDEPEAAGYIALAQAPWPGRLAVYRSADLAGFQLATTVPASALLGTTETVLAPGVEGRIEYASRLRVSVTGGLLHSMTRASLLDGANLAAVQAPDGLWEVLQFEVASLVGEREYELSGLLRAQGGTDDAMLAPIPAGATFVVLDSSLGRLDLTTDQIGLPFNWRYGPARYDIGHVTYGEATHAFSARARKPLSPVHVRGVRQGGDLHLTWVRRTRIGGDSWETAEVPLGEAEERYEVDILDGDNVVRTFVVDEPAAIYPAAEQTSDFGSPQTSITCEIYQMSTVAGRGTGRRITL
jgi:hypothetical protein